MKLFARYTVINLAANIAIFLLACIALYFSLRFVLVDQIDEDLEIEQAEIMAYVDKHGTLPEQFPASDQEVEFRPTLNSKKTFFHTIRKRNHHNHEESYREVTFSLKAGAQTYQAQVSKSLEKTNSLLRSILLIAMLTILSILAVSLFLNRVLIRKLWQPFYSALDALKKFRVSSSQPLTLPNTTINEFTYLNQTLRDMSASSRVEYEALKTFSENASHEVQTPLAIIRSKLDLLIQDDMVTEKHGATLEGVYDSVETLTRLNHGLLLLTRIDNHQFESTAPIDLTHILQTKVQEFTEIWQARGINTTIDLQPARVAMNAQLADTLINNLLSNATNHNRKNGSIGISLNADILIISNTSDEAALEPTKMYERFYKPSVSGSRNGLGLSIIRQIADVSNLLLAYRFENGEHIFTLSLHFLQRPGGERPGAALSATR